MSRSGRSGISALELELEEGAQGEADEELDDAELDEGEVDSEADDGELDDAELGDDEIESEADDGELDHAELGDDEMEEAYASELVEPDRHGFAERFHELATTEHESELEMELAVDGLVREMEQEYFFKGLLKKAGRFAKNAAIRYAKSTPLGGALKSLASGKMRSLLGGLAKTAISLAGSHPALAAALPALKALGFGGGAGSGKAPWANLVSVAKDAYGKLAQNAELEIRSPRGAQRAATRAFTGALRNAAVRTARRRGPRGAFSVVAGGPGAGRKRVVTLARGDRLVVRVR